MNRRFAALLVIAAVVALAALVLAGPTPSDAKWRCPRPWGWSETLQERGKSGELLAKWLAKHCWKVPPTKAPKPPPTDRKPTATPSATPAPSPTSTPEPTLTATPEPTPTLTPEPTPTATLEASPSPTAGPAGSADVRVVGLTAGSPASASAGQQFQLTAMLNLRNDGPAPSVVVDSTFSVAAPADCSVTPAAPVTVQNTTLPVNVDVSVSRLWNVICTQAGPHSFTVDASVVIDPLQTATDPDPNNNSGSGAASTQIN